MPPTRERSATLGLAPALPMIALVVIIAWALAAVLMLTGTLINAREIENTLPLINNEVQPIDQDLDNVKLAEETARISGRIRRRAAPLSDQADQIIEVAGNIDGRVATILDTAGTINDTAGSINETARSINGSVNSINDTVSSINGKVVSINDTVNSIQANALSINRTADSIGVKVTTINARVGSIFRRVGAPGATDRSIKGAVTRITRKFVLLDPVTKDIDEGNENNEGVDDINERATRGLRGVAALKSDFVPIRTIVGSGNPALDHDVSGPGNIHGHANAIDCSQILNFIGPTPYCNQ